MKSSIRLLAFVLAACPATSWAQGVKTPRPLPDMPDVKTPEALPVGALGMHPTRVLPTDCPPRVERPAKIAEPTSDRASSESQSGFAPDFSVMRFDEPGDGALWVRGRTYKARFDATRV